MNTLEALKPYFLNFDLFVGLVWKSIGLPKPTPIQVDIAKLLQNPPSDRFILEGFRGVAKSFITCAYVVWSLWRDPQLKIMVVSANKERADANATFIKKIINQLPFLYHLKAREGQRDTQNLFDVGPAKPDHSPSVKSVGIKGQLTGSRADIIVADDVQVPSNSFTQVLRDQLFELVKQFDAVLKPTKEAKIIYLGTPQNEMSLYNELQERGYKCIIYPARYPYDDSQRASYGDRLAPFIADKYDSDSSVAGKPTDPLRFNEQDLQKRQMSYRRAGFMLQFMLDTTLSDADRYPLRLRDLLVGMYPLDQAPMKLTWLPDATKRLSVSQAPVMGLKGDCYYYYHTASPQIEKYSYKMMCIDPSGRGKDQTGYAVLYYLNGYIFLMEVGGLLGGYSDSVLNKLALTAKKYKVQQVVIEGNFGDGMYTKLFQPVLAKVYPNGAGVTEVKSTGQKQLRIIDTLEPVISNHKLCTTPECIRNDYATVPQNDYKYACFYQMTRITQDRGALVHDDRLDALAIGVKYLVQFMGIDADQGIKQVTEQWLQDSMQSLMNFYTNKIGGITFTDKLNDRQSYESIHREK